MSFSADWLALREPYDRAARNAQVLDAVSAHFSGQSAIAVVDLACGTGSTMRSVAPRLPQRQNWRLIDNDLSLLARASALGDPPRLTVTARPVDLARDLELALEGPLELVTTSALFDLVSTPWLERLAVELAARNLPVYAALTYNGEAMLDPADPFDGRIVEAVNRHQRTDKGFGPALGPAAAAAAKRAFEAVGYTVDRGPLGLAVWAGRPGNPATDAGRLGRRRPGTGRPAGRRDRRLAKAAHGIHRRGRSAMTVGHVDLFARPTGRR